MAKEIQELAELNDVIGLWSIPAGERRNATKVRITGKGTKMICTVVVSKDDDMYIAKDLRTNIADQGETAEKALSNLKEALELYYDGNGIVESVVIK